MLDRYHFAILRTDMAEAVEALDRCLARPAPALSRAHYAFQAFASEADRLRQRHASPAPSGPTPAP